MTILITISLYDRKRNVPRSKPANSKDFTSEKKTKLKIHLMFPTTPWAWYRTQVSVCRKSGRKCKRTEQVNAIFASTMSVATEPPRLPRDLNAVDYKVWTSSSSECISCTCITLINWSRTWCTHHRRCNWRAAWSSSSARRSRHFEQLKVPKSNQTLSAI